MTSDVSNDNNAAPSGRGFHVPDAHGQAAMLLVESLIHGLIAQSVISVADAVEIVDTAAEVKEDVAASLGDTPATLQMSLTLLKTISMSLRADLPR